MLLKFIRCYVGSVFSFFFFLFCWITSLFAPSPDDEGVAAAEVSDIAAVPEAEVVAGGAVANEAGCNADVIIDGSTAQVVLDDATAVTAEDSSGAAVSGSACGMPLPNYAEILQTLNYTFTG